MHPQALSASPKWDLFILPPSSSLPQINYYKKMYNLSGGLLPQITIYRGVYFLKLTIIKKNVQSVRRST